MHGDRDNPDAEFACQSTGPRECVVPASRTGEQVFSDVHVYYFGGGAETRYVGSFGIGFFEGAEAGARERPTNITVPDGQKVFNQSITGIVTNTPGTYSLQFALDASTGGAAARQSIREQVAVVIR